MLDMVTDRPVKHPPARTEWIDLPPQPCDSRGGFPWYVVQTAPFQEEKVMERLEERGFGIFLPKIVEERVKRRFRWGRFYEERRRKQVVCFPGYVFVAFDIAQPEWRSIHKVKGVEGIISAGAERPIPVPPAAMRVLIELGYDRPMVKDPVPELIKHGALVRVTEGPFASFQGICLWSRKDRVRLLMSVFGRQSEIEISPKSVSVDS